jgi:predicted transcriptional regulator
MTISHTPTAAIRRWVAIAAGAGAAHEEIAMGLGITRPTLRKHYRLELSTGAAMRRLEVLNAIYRAAMQGRVSAIKAYLAAWRRTQQRHGTRGRR